MNSNQSCSCHTSGTYNVHSNNPTAHITVNRNRVKLYSNEIYLRDGSNFEIELWNPKTTRVLAKISVNGISISSGGIVVNPGQRIYLERFIDEDRKFKYMTYEAENTIDGRNAIANNGEVSVLFYDELFYTPPQVYQQNYWFYSGQTAGTPVIYGPTCTTINSSFVSDTANFCSDVIGARLDGNANNISYRSSYPTSPTIETGRIEKGEKSNQSLVDTVGSFSSFSCVSLYFKILPESQKPKEAKEIRYYCTGCGRRWRPNEKFCPSCGIARNN